MAAYRNVTAAALLIALGTATLASGCSRPQDDGGAPESAAQATGAAAESPFGKTSNETALPPQGKPPEPGEDVGARARAAAGGGGQARPRPQ